jgi:hypothetical protein
MASRSAETARRPCTGRVTNPFALAVWTGDHDDVPVRIAQPHLAMLRGRIDVRLLNDRRLEGPHALHWGVEVVHLKPQKNAVPNWCRVGVDEVRVLLFIPCV